MFTCSQFMKRMNILRNERLHDGCDTGLSQTLTSICLWNNFVFHTARTCGQYSHPWKGIFNVTKIISSIKKLAGRERTRGQAHIQTIQQILRVTVSVLRQLAVNWWHSRECGILQILIRTSATASQVCVKCYWCFFCFEMFQLMNW